MGALAAALLTLLVMGLHGCGFFEAIASAQPAKAGRSGFDLEREVATLRASAHADVECRECHVGSEGEAGAGKMMAPARCASCHRKAAATYGKSIHANAAAEGEEGAVTCASCHGGHDIHLLGDKRSGLDKRSITKTCMRCHQTGKSLAGKQAADDYAKSIHGHGLLDVGTVVSPSCSDCHGAHDVRAAKDAESRVSPANVSGTCGTCHQGILSTYMTSVHGESLARGDGEAPTCISCHTSHLIEKPATNFKLESDERCGACHQDRLAEHLQTFHGRAHSLGSAAVATCSDCHGSHETQKASDSRSLVSVANKPATCRKCHQQAPAAFASYFAHGNPRDPGAYPQLYFTYRAMAVLLVAVFGFFALHSLVWLLRMLVEFLRGPRAFMADWRKGRIEMEGRRGPAVRPVDRLVHGLMITSFIMLVATGMPLKFASTEWAQRVFELLGGAEVASTLHRLGAGITFTYVVVHIFSLVASGWRQLKRARRDGHPLGGALVGVAFGPDSPLPNRQDVRDLWEHVKWFVGRRDQPRFGRFAYWEKLDYLALLVGVCVIAFTGLVMWVPETATTILPGWMINIAQMIHSDEALLFAGFIATFHVFHLWQSYHRRDVPVVRKPTPPAEAPISTPGDEHDESHQLAHSQV